MSSYSQMDAQELFIHFSGSKFLMHREDVLEHYESFGITKEQERRWIKAATQEMVAGLKQAPIANSDYSGVMNMIREYRDARSYSEILYAIEGIDDPVDTFSLIRFSEEIFRLCSSENFGDEVSYADKAYAVGLCKHLLGQASDQAIYINSYFLNQPHLEDTFAEVTLRKRMSDLQNKIDDWEQDILR